MKDLVDQLYLSGVNHILLSLTARLLTGRAPWPGWLFYASTEMNSRNAMFHDVPALNAYITRTPVHAAGRESR